MDGRKLRFEYATCGREWIFENGGKILRFQKYPDSVDKAFKYTWLLLWLVIMPDEMS